MIATSGLYLHGCPPQVLEVVRTNYDTLTLKLQDGLDQFERYSEQPREAAFFKELVRRERRTDAQTDRCFDPEHLDPEQPKRNHNISVVVRMFIEPRASTNHH